MRELYKITRMKFYEHQIWYTGLLFEAKNFWTRDRCDSFFPFFFN